MAIRRQTALRVKTLLDDWLPPRLRDSKILGRLALRLAVRDWAPIFLNFRQDSSTFADKDFADLYESIADFEALQGETDLTIDCANRVLEAVVGKTVLEVGCGRGYLLKALSTQDREVTGLDVALASVSLDQSIHLVEGSVTSLPFDNASFDTVVCTHTLKHIPDIRRALQELRRCAKQRVIIVVPKERPYAWGFNLHLHFFPYEYTLRNFVGNSSSGRIEDLGDWLYIEDRDR